MIYELWISVSKFWSLHNFPIYSLVINSYEIEMKTQVLNPFSFRNNFENFLSTIVYRNFEHVLHTTMKSHNYKYIYIYKYQMFYTYIYIAVIRNATFRIEKPRTHGFVAYLKLKEVFCLAVARSARLLVPSRVLRDIESVCIIMYKYFMCAKLFDCGCGFL